MDNKVQRLREPLEKYKSLGTSVHYEYPIVKNHICLVSKSAS